jgi:hypothetical protein
MPVDWFAAWWASLTGLEIVVIVVAVCWLVALCCAPAVFGENPHESDSEMESLAEGAPASQAENCVLPAALRDQAVQRGAGGPVCGCPTCAWHRSLVGRGYAYVGGQFVGTN